MKTNNKKSQKKGDTKSGKKVTGRKKRKKLKNTKELLPYNNNISKKKIVKKNKKVDKRKIVKKKNGKHPGGRPPIKNKDKIVNKLLEGAEMDCSISEMCFLANISRETYYNWIKKDKKLLDRLERVRNKPIVTARKAVTKGIKNNPEFALKYLERKRSNEFSLKTKVEQSGSVDNNLLFTDADLFLKKTKSKKKK